VKDKAVIDIWLSRFNEDIFPVYQEIKESSKLESQEVLGLLVWWALVSISNEMMSQRRGRSLIEFLADMGAEEEPEGHFLTRAMGLSKKGSSE